MSRNQSVPEGQILSFFTFMQIASWQPYWIDSGNCFTCISYRCYLIIVPGFIDFNCAKAEKPLITHMHLQPLNAGFCTFMQISSRRPFWIESQNCLTCINYRCCVIVVPGFIDFCQIKAEKPLITYMIVKMWTHRRTDGQTDRRQTTDAK